MIQIKSNWPFVVVAVVTILIGLNMLFRTESVVRWYNSHGSPHPPDPAEDLRWTRIEGVAFILGGLYFLFNAVRMFFR
jgi:uncharacterized membrane protein YfcA